MGISIVSLRNEPPSLQPGASSWAAIFVELGLGTRQGTV